jgi:Leucine-rich repeat (LRR) protein
LAAPPDPPSAASLLPTRGCEALSELRLNHNQLAALPPELAANQRLLILEAGGNPIASLEDIQV